MTHRYLAAAMLLCAVAWDTDASSQVWSGDKSQIASFYGNLIVAPNSQTPTPSIAMAVSIGGTPVFSQGFGHVSPGGALATGDTVYHIGSVSKQLMAAAILALIEDMSGPVGPGGNSPASASIALDRPVTDYIPDSKSWSAAPVTLRNLLNMQSGFASYTTNPPATPTNPFDTTKPVKPRELLRFILSMLYSNPSPGGGQGYAYSNTNYFLLANVIEFFEARQTGVSAYNYQTFMKQRIFAHVGMAETGFIEDSFPGLVVAPPPYDLSNSSFAAPSWPMGAGEVASSANDLLKWQAALMSGTVISPHARNTVLTPVPGSGYAMGWAVNSGGGYNWYNHHGDIPGYVAFSGIFVNASTGAWVSVAVLANSDTAPVDQMGTCLAQLAMDPSMTQAGLGAGPGKACLLPDNGSPFHMPKLPHFPLQPPSGRTR